MAEMYNNRELSVYVHIPFCKKKCSYCDFLSFESCGYEKTKRYVDALCKEIAAYAAVAEEYVVKTIFIGGGTPSYIEASFIEQILYVIRNVFLVAQEAEITIEGNPDSLTLDKLTTYRNAGINRLSIGLQSANDDILQALGRVHTYDQFMDAFNNARQAGFENINVDIMSGLPGERTESYIHTLDKVVELQPEHISAYSLIVEEETPLSRNEMLLNLLPDEEQDRLLYAKTKLLLKSSGYNRYEISNYAREGWECKHNIVYWTGGEYLGVGLGASSHLKIQSQDGHGKPIRFHGIERMEDYIGIFSQCDGMREDDYATFYHLYENIEDYQMEQDSVNLSTDKGYPQYCQEYENNELLEFLRDYYMDLYFLKRKDEMEEFMFLGLRLMRGISKTEFKTRFGIAIESVYGEVIMKYKERKLLLESEDRLYLSDKGIDVSNMVMAEFMI